MKEFMRLARNYLNLRFHRNLLLEGVRLVASRNIGHLFRVQERLSIHRLTNDQEIHTVIDAMLEDQGMERDSVNRGSLARATWVPWQIYLCLLYAEIEFYRNVVRLDNNLIHSPLDKLLQIHKNDVGHWRDLRDKMLHPSKPLSVSSAIQAFAELEHMFLLVRDVQKEIDAYGAIFRQLLLDRIEDLVDVNLANDVQFETLKSPVMKLPPYIVVENVPSYENQTPFNIHAPRIRGWLGTPKGNSVPITDSSLRDIKEGCMEMLWSSLVLFNEFSHLHATDELSHDVQALDREIALLRVGCVLIHEPLRLYQDAVKKSSYFRHDGIEKHASTHSVQDALRKFRNGIFHVPSDKIDPDRLEDEFTALFDQFNFNPHFLLGQLMHFYSSIK